MCRNKKEKSHISREMGLRGFTTNKRNLYKFD